MLYNWPCELYYLILYLNGQPVSNLGHCAVAFVAKEVNQSLVKPPFNLYIWVQCYCLKELYVWVCNIFKISFLDTEMTLLMDHRNEMTVHCHHYSDFTWASWHLKSLATRLFVKQVVHADIKRNHQSWALPAFCEGNPPWPVVSLTKGQ